MTDNHDHHNELAHVMPVKVLLGVFGALLVLTGATVWVATHDLGRFDLSLALIIATVKAVLVALYFMHLRYDKVFNAIVFVVGILFVILFISLAVMDTGNYQSQLLRNADHVIRYR
ncbi:MAG: cytochrome C oxidase subunit IV family protein [Planctomycetes bacterium]|nr:cytochrome C oxidase subunit IV family protein [Planctomycetota bacterium]